MHYSIQMHEGPSLHCTAVRHTKVHCATLQRDESAYPLLLLRCAPRHQRGQALHSRREGTASAPPPSAKGSLEITHVSNAIWQLFCQYHRKGMTADGAYLPIKMSCSAYQHRNVDRTELPPKQILQ